ncbi:MULTISPECIES: Na(+)-translocating NADH-quinone reductase subunit C [Pasteurellaceae]|uniref:Na(+)-translocating NADH-quinone reductase subunit C n=1 Tax=Pasteurella bettyae CCUG 2042 TaxID=1095749 RepID=I3DJJ7_9PAST|nr:MULTISPECIES: Na(+)-translocating NADH-quinone reductase subunit C [Pasteurellaceae]EIJ71890.1 NADH:ubiquinone oxidoreductase, Na(+)-translocating, C subunit [Pasteurella bettyae CCUG 2042]SUB22379.1 Na(+)-translocating NADH-quinone reductase subunit C [Pasteurella bettyae]
MAKFNKDSVFGTVTVVLLLSLVCSIIVAGSAVALKPAQEEQKQLDKQKNILNVAGLLKENGNIKEIYSKFIEPRFVDLDTGDYVDSASTEVELIPADLDKAKIRSRSKTAEVYLVKNEQGKVEQIVLPIYGTGLWSVMYGFVSVAPDANTIKGITYYQHGETPGLGGEIENPNWQKLFVGKKLLDANNQPAIKIVKGQAPQDEHSIDGLSGATLTGNGVQGTFNYWFSDKGLGKYLEKLRAGAK